MRRTTFVLWDKRENKSITTLLELWPIMEGMGCYTTQVGRSTTFDGVFIPWIEYKFKHIRKIPFETPIIELPHIYIDGLHYFTYLAFLNAIDYHYKQFLGPILVIREISLGYVQEIHNKQWTYAEQFGDRIMRRPGTFDKKLLRKYRFEDYNIYERPSLKIKLIMTPFLALWNMIKNKPISTHEELRPIMKNFGFVMIDGRVTRFDGVKLVWIEYKYKNNVVPMQIKKELPIEETSSKTPPPPVVLPRDYLDGLHPFTYNAFIHAIHYYEKSLIPTGLLEIREEFLGLDDQNFKEGWMDAELYERQYVRRYGTLDPNLLYMDICNQGKIYNQ